MTVYRFKMAPNYPGLLTEKMIDNAQYLHIE